MEIRNELKLKKAKIVDITKYPKSPEPSRVLTIQLPLTTTLADALKCKDMCYDINDNQRKFEGGFGFDYELTNVEIKLERASGAMMPLSPKAIKRFRIGHDGKENLIATLRVHFVGYGNALEEWSDEINDKEFDAAIMSLQGELFPVGGSENKEGQAGGKRVDMSGGGPIDEMTANLARSERGYNEEEIASEFGPKDGPCVSCNNEIPFEDDTKTTHVTGQACARSAGASLAAAATVSGGTKKRRRSGSPEASGTTAGSVDRASLPEDHENFDVEDEPVVQ